MPSGASSGRDGGPPLAPPMTTAAGGDGWPALANAAAAPAKGSMCEMSEKAAREPGVTTNYRNLPMIRVARRLPDYSSISSTSRQKSSALPFPE